MTPIPDGATGLFIAATDHPLPTTVLHRGTGRHRHIYLQDLRALAALRAAGRRETDHLVQRHAQHSGLHQDAADEEGTAHSRPARALPRTNNNTYNIKAPRRFSGRFAILYF